MMLDKQDSFFFWFALCCARKRTCTSAEWSCEHGAPLHRKETTHQKEEYQHSNWLLNLPRLEAHSPSRSISKWSNFFFFFYTSDRSAFIAKMCCWEPSDPSRSIRVRWWEPGRQHDRIKEWKSLVATPQCCTSTFTGMKHTWHISQYKHAEFSPS